MAEPLVSVIMPVFRCNPTFLQYSLESVLLQSLSDLELLVVVDPSEPSSDKTMLDIFDHFRDDKRLKIINNKDRKGFVESLNSAILVSRGKYIARMDSDDISFPNRLDLQTNAIERNKADLVGSWAQVINEQGKVLGCLTPPTDAHMIRQSIMLHNPFIHSSVVFKKSILYSVGLYNPKLWGAEDYDLWLRLISQKYICINLPKFLVNIRETSKSIVRGGKWKKTRVSYTKAKMLGLAKYGYRDPLSIGSCFLGPISILAPPGESIRLKKILGWFKEDFALSEKRSV